MGLGRTPRWRSRHGRHGSADGRRPAPAGTGQGGVRGRFTPLDKGWEVPPPDTREGSRTPAGIAPRLPGSLPRAAAAPGSPLDARGRPWAPQCAADPPPRAAGPVAGCSRARAPARQPEIGLTCGRVPAGRPRQAEPSSEIEVAVVEKGKSLCGNYGTTPMRASTMWLATTLGGCHGLERDRSCEVSASGKPLRKRSDRRGMGSFGATASGPVVDGSSP